MVIANTDQSEFFVQTPSKRRKTEAEKLVAIVATPGPKAPGVVPDSMEICKTRSGKVFIKAVDQDADELRQHDIFDLALDSSPVQNRIDLVKQLLWQLRSSELGVDDEDAPEATRKIIEALESFLTQVKDLDDGTRSSTALLGMNGEGKSTLLNLFLHVTELLETHYALNRASKTRDEKNGRKDDGTLREWLFSHLEGVRDLLQRHSEGELPSTPVPNDVVFQERFLNDTLDVDGHYVAEDKREQEVMILRRFKDMYCVGVPHKDERAPYLLPAYARSVSSTKFTVKLRKGTTYHAVIRYTSEKDTRAELFDFDWHQLEELDDLHEDKDKEEIRHARNKLRKLLLVAGKNPDDTQYSIFKIARSGIEKVLGDLVPKSEEEVQICSKVQEKQKIGIEIITGRGRRLLDDRLFLREGIHKVMEDLTIATIIDELILYSPADALEASELVDAPGAGSDCPMEQMHLKEAVRVADNVLVVMQRNLGSTADLTPHIKESLVLEKILQSHVNGEDYTCPLHLFSAMDEIKEFQLAGGFNAAMNEFIEDKSKVSAQNEEKLQNLLFQTLKDMIEAKKIREMDNDERADMLDAVCANILKSSMFSTKPFLWTSLTLSLEEKELGANVRKNCLLALVCVRVCVWGGVYGWVVVCASVCVCVRVCLCARVRFGTCA